MSATPGTDARVSRFSRFAAFIFSEIKQSVLIFQENNTVFFAVKLGYCLGNPKHGHGNYHLSVFRCGCLLWNRQLVPILRRWYRIVCSKSQVLSWATLRTDTKTTTFPCFAAFISSEIRQRCWQFGENVLSYPLPQKWLRCCLSQPWVRIRRTPIPRIPLRCFSLSERLLQIKRSRGKSESSLLIIFDCHFFSTPVTECTSARIWH